MTEEELALLRIRRATVVAQLAAMTSTSIGGMPNTNGGESIDHHEYKDGLYRELKQLNEILGLAECYEFIS